MGECRRRVHRRIRNCRNHASSRRRPHSFPRSYNIFPVLSFFVWFCIEYLWFTLHLMMHELQIFQLPRTILMLSSPFLVWRLILSLFSSHCFDLLWYPNFSLLMYDEMNLEHSGYVIWSAWCYTSFNLFDLMKWP